MSPGGMGTGQTVVIIAAYVDMKHAGSNYSRGDGGYKNVIRLGPCSASHMRKN